MSGRAVDFSRDPGWRQTGPILLVVGALSVATSLWIREQWRSERVAREQALSRAVPVRAPVKSVRAEPTVHQKRQASAQEELQRPWVHTLQAVERSTQEPVYLLSLSLEPERGGIRIEAEASTFSQAVDYMERLRSTGALQGVTLASHEHLFDGTGKSAVRFVVTGQWTAP